jgi:hypothetical protein
MFVKTFYDMITPEELDKITKCFVIKKNYMEIKNMITKEKDIFRLARLDEFPIQEKASEISSENIYEQICFCYQNVNDIKSKKLNIKQLDNFKKDEILNVIKSLIQIKSILGQFDEEMQKLNGLLECITS